MRSWGDMVGRSPFLAALGFRLEGRARRRPSRAEIRRPLRDGQHDACFLVWTDAVPESLAWAYSNLGACSHACGGALTRVRNWPLLWYLPSDLFETAVIVTVGTEGNADETGFAGCLTGLRRA